MMMMVNHGQSWIGWSNLFPKDAGITDGTVGMLIAITLFFIPSKKNFRGEPIENKSDGMIINEQYHYH